MPQYVLDRLRSGKPFIGTSGGTYFPQESFVGLFKQIADNMAATVYQLRPKIITKQKFYGYTISLFKGTAGVTAP